MKIKLILYIIRVGWDETRQYSNLSQICNRLKKKSQTHLKPIHLNFKFVSLEIGQNETSIKKTRFIIIPNFY